MPIFVPNDDMQEFLLWGRAYLVKARADAEAAKSSSYEPQQLAAVKALEDKLAKYEQALKEARS